MKQIILFFCLLTFLSPLQSQDKKSVYNVNKWLSGSIIIGGTATNVIGRELFINAKDPISHNTLDALIKSDVNGFDQYALDRNLEKVESWEKFSDLSLTAANAMVLGLFIDKNIRKDWLDITFLFLETQLISANVYTISPVGPTFINRLRPKTYYETLAFSERSKSTNRNSFFSGHVSSAASASFFIAKVYADYHPEMKGKFWLYAAASIPPALVAYARVNSLFHFPSDALSGFLLGAATGILIPSLHKKDSQTDLSMWMNDQGIGIFAKLQF